MKTILSRLSIFSLVCLLSCGKVTPPVDEQVDVEVCDPASPAGCSWSLQSETDLAHYREALDIIDANTDGATAKLSSQDKAYKEMMASISTALERHDSIENVVVDQRWIRFTVLPGGYPHDVVIGMEQPIPLEAGKQLAKAPEDLEERIERLFESVAPRKQALVTEAARPLPYQKKRARMLAPWNWYFEPYSNTRAEFAHFRGELERLRDYQSPGDVEVHIRKSPWVPKEENAEEGFLPFMGWGELDLISVFTHGKNAPFRLSAGIVVGHDPGGDAARREGISCEELWRTRVPRGVFCSAWTEIAVEGDEEKHTLYVLGVDQRFLEKHGSKLSDTQSVLILESCSTLKDVEKDLLVQGFFGSKSAVYGGDETVEPSEAPVKFLTALATLGLPTHIAYALMTEEDHTSFFGGGVYRLFPATASLRLAEVISLHAPGEDEHLKDGATLPVELDDEGRPRLLKVDARYFGVLTQDIDKTLFGAPQRYEIQDDPSLWVTRVEEMSGPGEDATSRGNLLGEPRTLFTNPMPVDSGLTEFKKELQLKFDRDLDTTEPIYLMATVELPEGGISTHTVYITPIPLEATWSLEGNEVTPGGVARGHFVQGLHQETLKRLSVYMRDDGESFLAGNSAHVVDLTLTGFEGSPGTYTNTLVNIRYGAPDVRCVSATGRVELEAYTDADHFEGSFVTGADTVCYVQDEPAMDASPLTGTFLLNKP